MNQKPQLTNGKTDSVKVYPYFARSLSTTKTGSKNTKPTPAAAKKLIQKLVDLFRLHDWDIEVSFVNSSEMVARGWLGSCSPDTSRRKAIIELQDQDAFPQETGLSPYESVLIHEILHIVVDDALVSPLQTKEEERLVHTLEAAIHKILK